MDRDEKITEVDAADWWRTFEVNILGSFLVSRNFLPLLLKQSSSLKTIVNLSSMWGLTHFPKNTAYQLSKFTIIRLSQILNAEYGDQGVLSFSVHPGSVSTELADILPADLKQFLLDTPALGADTVVWLTAERREWLAGRWVNAAWDMKEILEKKERIVKEDHLKMRLSVGLE